MPPPLPPLPSVLPGRRAFDSRNLFLSDDEEEESAPVPVIPPTEAVALGGSLVLSPTASFEPRFLFGFSVLKIV